MPLITRPRVVASLVLAGWMAGIGGGFHALWRYTATPGPAAETRPAWPSSAIEHDPHLPTLVLTLHPECACSGATLESLSRVSRAANGRVAIIVLIGGQGGAHSPTNASDLERAAAAIPGATVIADRDGGEAARFGALVSGQTFLYDHDGRLLFSGGITAGRGHAGENDGEIALRRLIAERASPIQRTPVFGCLLAGSRS
jgi:hypothetical protein